MTTPTPAQVEALIEVLKMRADIFADDGRRAAASDLLEAASALAALRDEVKALDPDPVVCGCREAGCPHTPIAKLPRQALVDHYKEHIRTVETDRDALRDENAAYKEIVEDKRRIAREIEVIMFGKDAAPQPALCDIQASVRKLVDESAALTKERDDYLKEAQHYHHAVYENGRLTDKCAECPFDLRNPIHIRAGGLA